MTTQWFLEEEKKLLYLWGMYQEDVCMYVSGRVSSLHIVQHLSLSKERKADIYGLTIYSLKIYHEAGIIQITTDASIKKQTSVPAIKELRA